MLCCSSSSEPQLLASLPAVLMALDLRWNCLRASRSALSFATSTCTARNTMVDMQGRHRGRGGGKGADGVAAGGLTPYESKCPPTRLYQHVVR